MNHNILYLVCYLSKVFEWQKNFHYYYTFIQKENNKCNVSMYIAGKNLLNPSKMIQSKQIIIMIASWVR